MIMANPYLPPEIPQAADLPEAPHAITPAERRPSFFPIALVVVIVIGLGYYFYGQSTMSPSMRATDAVSKTDPSRH
jgi:hypothetical protein